MNQFCISCGIENSNEAKFCKSCGQKLKTEETEKFEQEERAAQGKKLKEEKELAEKEKYSSIGGWLMFFAVILVIGNISWLAYIVNTYAGDEFTSTIETLYMQGYTQQVSYLNILVAVELTGYFFVLLFTINFFMKSPITRALMIIYSIVMIISVPVSISLLYKINPDVSNASEIGKMIGSTFWAIVWMLYFIFSKRVKKTFVAKDGNEPENSLVITIIFALLIPGYFGYKHYDTVSNLKSISTNSQKLMDVAVELRDKQEYEKAIPYFVKAAELDDPRAMLGLCAAYIEGEGVKKNLYTASQWCKDSYTKSDNMLVKEVSSDLMGHIYFNQDDFKNAKTWYLRELEHIEGKDKKGKRAEEIAEKYFNSKHYTTSAYWYKVAVDNGNKSAMFRLAYSYSKRKKYKDAIKWYKKSNEYSKWHGTMGNLANVYIDIKEYKKAIYWFKKAIKNGSTSNYTNYGYAHDMLGNKAQAIKWYKEGANKNKSAVAMNNLGIVYQNQGDYVKSKYWNDRAKKAGYK